MVDVLCSACSRHKSKVQDKIKPLLKQLQNSIGSMRPDDLKDFLYEELASLPNNRPNREFKDDCLPVIASTLKCYQVMECNSGA